MASRARALCGLFCLVAAAALFRTANAAPAGEPAIAIIPKPVQATLGEGVFRLNADTVIQAGPELERMGARLAAMLHDRAGLALGREQGEPGAAPRNNAIVLALDANLGRLGREGYTLEATPERVLLRAPAQPGLLHAFQTLLQLLPAEVLQPEAAARLAPEGRVLEVPSVAIEDHPRFAWRGAMLDVSRHFMPIDFLKKLIEVLALHKINRFHLHLTDDQGWRIEIKKYPRLTEKGAWRDETLVGRPGEQPLQYDGKRHGGFYTQAEIRELVAFAAERGITIVPEIEMPGHAQAAIASYPRLGNLGEELPVATAWGVNRNIFNASEETILFLQDVLAEVIELFPSEFIHIGGDEAVKDQWQASAAAQARIRELGLRNEDELQSYFIKRMDEFLSKRGRRLIGWDEILEGGLAPNAAVMSWRGDQGGIVAARAGHDVVMAPTHSTYFDYYQSRSKTEPLAIGGFLPLEKVYLYEPIPAELSAGEAQHVLGTQGQIWTEYIAEPKQAEYMGFPRLCALSEVAWSAKEGKDFAEFRERLKTHLRRLDALGVNFRPLDEPEEAKKTMQRVEITDPIDRGILEAFLRQVETVPTRLSAEACRVMARDNVEGYTWQLCRYLEMPLVAFELTGDRKHLAAFTRAFANMRSALTTGPDGFLGWYGLPIDIFRNPENPDLQVDVTINSFRVAAVLAAFLEIAGGSEELAAEFGSLRAEYLDLIENHLVKKWFSRGNFVDLGGRGAVFRTRPDLKDVKANLTLPHNKHSIILHGLTGLYRVTGNDDYMRAAVKLGVWFKRCLTLKDGHYEWNYWDPAGEWDVHPRDGGAWKHWINVEHTGGYYAASAAQAIELYNHGLVFEREDIDRFARTQVEVCWNGDFTSPVWSRCDGSGPPNRMKGAYLCPQLAPFNDRIHQLAFGAWGQNELVQAREHSWHAGPLAGEWLHQKYVSGPQAKGGRQVFREAGRTFEAANVEFLDTLEYAVKGSGYAAPRRPAEMKPMPPGRSIALQGLRDEAGRGVEARLISVAKVWGEAPHSAFTDLARFKGEWFLAFREGADHVSPDGRLQVLRSADGEAWTSATRISGDADLRDPKLCVTPRNELMLSAAAAFRQPGETRHRTLAWFSADGSTWSNGQAIGDRDSWLWRVAWHEGRAFGIAYDTAGGGFVRLYTSEDGTSFSVAADRIFCEGGPSEASLLFIGDGTCLCLLRRDQGSATAQLGKSAPPYQTWSWKDLGKRIGGPQLIRLPGGAILAAGRLYDGRVRTALCRLDPEAGRLDEILAFPSAGDTGYPGLAWDEGVLFASYYSSHEGKTSIYLARVSLSGPGVEFDCEGGPR